MAIKELSDLLIRINLVEESKIDYDLRWDIIDTLNRYIQSKQLNTSNISECGADKNDKAMEWNEIDKVLPNDKQKITVYNEGLQKELHRTFYFEFWQKHNRILDCSCFCKKWKPRE